MMMLYFESIPKIGLQSQGGLHFCDDQTLLKSQMMML